MPRYLIILFDICLCKTVSLSSLSVFLSVDGRSARAPFLRVLLPSRRKHRGGGKEVAHKTASILRIMRTARSRLALVTSARIDSRSRKSTPLYPPLPSYPPTSFVLPTEHVDSSSDRLVTCSFCNYYVLAPGMPMYIIAD